MTDLQINIALAKAMGWETDQLAASIDKDVYAADWPRKDNRATVLQNRALHPLHLMPWCKFDYRDPVIFTAICKHWGLVVYFANRPNTGGFARASDLNNRFIENDCIEKAAALCVIEAVKRGIK